MFRLRPGCKASNKTLLCRARHIKFRRLCSNICRDLQMPQPSMPRPASSRSKRPSCCPLARTLQSMIACSPFTFSQLISNMSVASIADPDKLQFHPPPCTHCRTCSHPLLQPLCPNLPLELHLPSRRRSQVNRHVRTHFVPLPNLPPQLSALHLSLSRRCIYKMHTSYGLATPPICILRTQSRRELRAVRGDSTAEWSNMREGAHTSYVSG